MPADQTHLTIDGLEFFILSLAVLFIGTVATNRVGILLDNNIPSAVTGGLACSVVVAAIYGFAGLRIEFVSDLPELLLLAFFATVGFSAKLKTMRQDLGAILVLLVLAGALLIFQNMAGAAVAATLGHHPAYGLIGGSISFVGGHGTALAWGDIFTERFGLPDATDVALACATFGLVLGGLLGGPIARRLIERHELRGTTAEVDCTPSMDAPFKRGPMTMDSMLVAILLVAVCVAIARDAPQWVAAFGVTIPSFVFALLAGAVLTNVVDLIRYDLNVSSIGLISDVTLQLFVTMSIMGIQLWLLTSGIAALLAIFILQPLIMIVFVYFVLFPVMGRDYDSSVMCAGFVGFGLGATPVGLVNMRAITSR